MNFGEGVIDFVTGKHRAGYEGHEDHEGHADHVWKTRQLGVS